MNNNNNNNNNQIDTNTISIADLAFDSMFATNFILRVGNAMRNAQTINPPSTIIHTTNAPTPIPTTIIPVTAPVHRHRNVCVYRKKKYNPILLKAMHKIYNKIHQKSQFHKNPDDALIYFLNGHKISKDLVKAMIYTGAKISLDTFITLCNETCYDEDIELVSDYIKVIEQTETPEIIDNYIEEGLLESCSTNNFLIAKYLLDNYNPKNLNAAVEILNYNEEDCGRTESFINMVKLLIEHGANSYDNILFNICDQSIYSGCCTECYLRFIPLVTNIINNCTKKCINKCLLSVCQYGGLCKEIIAILIDNGATNFNEAYEVYCIESQINTQDQNLLKMLIINDYKNGIVNIPKYTKINDFIRENNIIEDNLIDLPLRFICPISGCLMKDPVIIESGRTYDRQGIEKWLSLNNTDPETRSILSNKYIISCHYVSQEILEYLGSVKKKIK